MSARRADELVSRAVQAQQGGNAAEAEALYRKAIKAAPTHLAALAGLAALLGNLGRGNEALPLIQRTVALRPEDAGLWCNLALASLETAQLAQAREAVARAARLAPDSAMVLVHQGLVANEAGDAGAAETHFRAALEREDSTASLFPLTGVLNARDAFEESAALLGGFLRRHPGDEAAHFSLAITLLLLGRLREGWQHFDWRPETRFRRAQGGSRPDAAALRGRRLVVHAEQGLGDQLFFLRFLPAFRALAQPAHVTLACEPRLVPIAKRLEGVDEAVPMTSAHAELLLGDFPVYAASDATPPAQRIPAPEAARARARAALNAAGPAPWLGVTWEAGTPLGQVAGNRLANSLLRKRIEPAELGRAAAAWRGTVVALQRNARPGDHAALEAALGRKVADFSGWHQDLEGLLGLVASLDDYVGVSNTNMHLLAAIGRGARVLAVRPYEWRWMSSGEASPWFPGFRVYREQRGEGWGPALRALERDLGAKA